MSKVVRVKDIRREFDSLIEEIDNDLWQFETPGDARNTLRELLNKIVRKTV